MGKTKVTQDVLNDFSATLDAKSDLTTDELLQKFPEFNNDENLLQAAVDYHTTSKSGKYKTLEELNSKFPEFGFSPKQSTSSQGAENGVVPYAPKPEQETSPYALQSAATTSESTKKPSSTNPYSVNVINAEDRTRVIPAKNESTDQRDILILQKQKQATRQQLHKTNNVLGDNLSVYNIQKRTLDELNKKLQENNFISEDEKKKTIAQAIRVQNEITPVQERVNQDIVEKQKLETEIADKSNSIKRLLPKADKTVWGGVKRAFNQNLEDTKDGVYLFSATPQHQVEFLEDNYLLHKDEAPLKENDLLSWKGITELVAGVAPDIAAAPFLGGVGSAVKMGMMQYGGDAKRVYKLARENGQTPEQALETVHKIRNISLATGGLEGALGATTNRVLERGAVKVLGDKVATKAITNLVIEPLVEGGAAGTLNIARNIQENEAGLPNKPITEGFGENLAGEALFSFGANALGMGGAAIRRNRQNTSISKEISDKIIAAENNPEQLEKLIQNIDLLRDNKIVDEAYADKLRATAIKYQEAAQKIPSNVKESITPDAQSEIVQKVAEKSDLNEELKNVDDSFKEPIQEKITALDTEIKHIAEGKLGEPIKFTSPTNDKYGYVEENGVKRDLTKKEFENYAKVDMEQQVEAATTEEPKGVGKGTKEINQENIDKINYTLRDNENNVLVRLPLSNIETGVPKGNIFAEQRKGAAQAHLEGAVSGHDKENTATQASLDKDGNLFIADGRHRVEAQKDSGVEYGWFEVPKDQAKEIESKYETPKSEEAIVPSEESPVNLEKNGTNSQVNEAENLTIESSQNPTLTPESEFNVEENQQGKEEVVGKIYKDNFNRTFEVKSENTGVLTLEDVETGKILRKKKSEVLSDFKEVIENEANNNERYKNLINKINKKQELSKDDIRTQMEMQNKQPHEYDKEVFDKLFFVSIKSSGSDKGITLKNKVTGNTYWIHSADLGFFHQIQDKESPMTLDIAKKIFNEKNKKVALDIAYENKLEEAKYEKRKQGKEEVNNTKNDKENKQGLQGNERIGQEPIKAKSNEATSGKEAETSGVLQTQEIKPTEQGKEKVGSGVGGDVEIRKKEMQSENDKLIKRKRELANDRDDVVTGEGKYKNFGKKERDAKLEEIRNEVNDIDSKQVALQKELKVIEAKEIGSVELFDHPSTNHGSTNTIIYDIKNDKLVERENVVRGKTNDISIEDAAKQKFAKTLRGANQREINEAYTDKVKAKYESEITDEINKYKAVEELLTPNTNNNGKINEVRADFIKGLDNGLNVRIFDENIQNEINSDSRDAKVVLDMGFNEATLSKSEQQSLQALWRERHNSKQGMDDLLKFLFRHGAKANTETLVGQSEQQRRVLQGELSLGNEKGASQQQKETEASNFAKNNKKDNNNNGNGKNANAKTMGDGVGDSILNISEKDSKGVQQYRNISEKEDASTTNEVNNNNDVGQQGNVSNGSVENNGNKIQHPNEKNLPNGQKTNVQEEVTTDTTTPVSKESVENLTKAEKQFKEANEKVGVKAKEKALDKFINDNFESIVSQLMLNNTIKRKC